MFGYEDRRTEQERNRDLRQADERHANTLLALGFLKNVVKPQLVATGAEVGLAGNALFSGAEMLVEVGGVTYKLSARVDHD